MQTIVTYLIRLGRYRLFYIFLVRIFLTTIRCSIKCNSSLSLHPHVQLKFIRKDERRDMLSTIPCAVHVNVIPVESLI